MSHDGQNSSLPNIRVPKPTFDLNGAAFPGLGLSGFDVDEDIILVVHGTITKKAKNQFQEGAMDIAFKVNQIENRTPQKQRIEVDEDNRIR